VAVTQAEIVAVDLDGAAVVDSVVVDVAATVVATAAADATAVVTVAVAQNQMNWDRCTDSEPIAVVAVDSIVVATPTREQTVVDAFQCIVALK
jgi:hypothetical protein